VGPPVTDAETVTEPGVEDAPANDRPAALLRGGAKGLEIFVRGTCTVDAIAAAIEAKLGPDAERKALEDLAAPLSRAA